MAISTPQQLSIPTELKDAILAARGSFMIHKALVKCYPSSFTKNGKAMQRLTVSFVNYPQSLAQAKNVWTTLGYTLWEEDVARIGDYLLQFADSEGRQTLTVGYDIHDVYMEKYTDKDGNEKETPKLRWVSLMSSEFLLTLGKREEAEEDPNQQFLAEDGEEEL